MAGLSAATSSLHVMRTDVRRAMTGPVLCGVVVLGLLLMLFTEALRWPMALNYFAVGLMLLPVAAGLLGSRWRVLGVWLLVLGCLGAPSLALHWVPYGVVLCLLALPAGIAALLIGARAGLAAAALASVIVARALAWPELAGGPWPAVALVAIWGAAGLAGIAAHLHDQVTESLWTSYLRMQQALEEARDQRLELRQTQEDLVHANTELARLTDRLAQMYQIAEEARRAKEEFVANVSHELRTPLNMIIGFSEMISEAPYAYSSDLPPALLSDVDVILRNSRHLAGLVDDVLDLSQVDAGKMTLHREWCELGEVLEAALVAVQPLLQAKDLDFACDISAGLPPVYCDRTRIRQVMLNLLSNAARYTEEGDVRVQVRREGGTVVVSVADSGPGIAKEDRERVFEPFQQVDGSIRRQFGGTGLGLSISRRLIEAHGGRMWLESELGVGSTFHFSLPAEEAPALSQDDALRWLAASYYDKPQRRLSKAPKAQPAPRYIVVEPRNVLSRLLARYLEGAEVASYRRIEEAVEDLKRSPEQVLIINDPAVERAGSFVMPAAGQLPYSTPSIACWVPGEEEAAARLGVARYLLKPVSLQALRQALDGLERDVKTILLVDDEPEMLQLFGRMLASTGEGYRLLRAYNGQMALDMLRERRPDVVLLDLVMPGIDGYRIIEEKKRDPEVSDIPVIAISALDPARESIIGNSLTLTRSNGLAFQDLLSCIRMWSGLTSQAWGRADQEPPESRGG